MQKCGSGKPARVASAPEIGHTLLFVLVVPLDTVQVNCHRCVAKIFNLPHSINMQFSRQPEYRYTSGIMKQLGLTRRPS
jgi:hypothetical protein